MQREEEIELEQELKQALVAQQQETNDLHVIHDSNVHKYHGYEEVYSKVEQKQVRTLGARSMVTIFSSHLPPLIMCLQKNSCSAS